MKQRYRIRSFFAGDENKSFHVALILFCKGGSMMPDDRLAVLISAALKDLRRQLRKTKRKVSLLEGRTTEDVRTRRTPLRPSFQRTPPQAEVR